MSDQNTAGTPAPAEATPALKFQMPDSLMGMPGAAAQDALLEAFPTQKHLAAMLKERMNVRLDCIVGSCAYGHTVFQLIGWAERNGRVDELFQAAYAENPNCHELNEFLKRYPVK